MHKTLFARMTTKNATAFAPMKKPSETQGNGETMKTAATLNEAPNRSTTMNGLGVTSPFKDAMAKGVVSGMGLLSF